MLVVDGDDRSGALRLFAPVRTTATTIISGSIKTQNGLPFW